MGAGALQPCSVLQVATPLPCCPPKPTAIFTSDGITAMHLACAITLSGIALSGIAIISFRTSADLSIRLSMSVWSLSSFAQLMLPKIRTTLPSANKYFAAACFRNVILTLFRTQSGTQDCLLHDCNPGANHGLSGSRGRCQ